eukprot:1178294-Prorocentrum_minimum.AAC.1
MCYLYNVYCSIVQARCTAKKGESLKVPPGLSPSLALARIEDPCQGFCGPPSGGCKPTPPLFIYSIESGGSRPPRGWVCRIRGGEGSGPSHRQSTPKTKTSTTS